MFPARTKPPAGEVWGAMLAVFHATVIARVADYYHR